MLKGHTNSNGGKPRHSGRNSTRQDWRSGEPVDHRIEPKKAIREGHEVYVAQMLGDVPTTLEEGDEWKIQGLKMGLWEEYTKLEKMGEEILGIMAKIGGLDLSKEAGSSGKRRMNVHLAIMKLDQALESLKL